MDVDTLEQYDNYTQLTYLRREIQDILFRTIQPSEEWYRDRIRKVVTYSELDWTGMALRFDGKDHHLHHVATRIVELHDVILEQWSVSPHFHLPTYAHLLEEIDHLWDYYRNQYVGEETDEEVIELIENLTHMMK